MKVTHNVTINAKNISQVKALCDCGWSENGLLSIEVAKSVWKFHIKRSKDAKAGSVRIIK